MPPIRPELLDELLKDYQKHVRQLLSSGVFEAIPQPEIFDDGLYREDHQYNQDN